MPASSAKVFCRVLRSQAPQEGLGGCTRRPCEQLRGSAALCWEMRAEPSQEEVLGEELDAPPCSGLVSAHKHSEPPVPKQRPGCSLLLTVAVRSGSTTKAAGVGAGWVQVSSPNPPLYPSHLSPLYLMQEPAFSTFVLSHLHLLSSQPVMQLLSQNSSGWRAEQSPPPYT